MNVSSTKRILVNCACLVVLRGFVASEWDLRDAIRIASKAAGDRRVIDDLSITQGGNR